MSCRYVSLKHQREFFETLKIYFLTQMPIAQTHICGSLAVFDENTFKIDYLIIRVSTEIGQYLFLF